MVERQKDSDDRMLEALFRPEAIADDGFSKRVVARVRRRVWTRRITLPLAVVLGSLVAAEPVVAFLKTAIELLSTVSGASITPDWVPSSFTLVAGAVLFGILLTTLNLLEE